MRVVLASVFCFLLLAMFSSISYADMMIKSETKPVANGMVYKTFYITSREDKPVTVTGYVINRGNLLSNEQIMYDKSKHDLYKFKPKELKFGQTMQLFNVNPKDQVLEVLVKTSAGDYTFTFNQ